MALHAQIVADALAARRERRAADIALLVTLGAEAAKVGKDAGNRAPTDEETLAVVRKFLKGLHETLKVRPDDVTAQAEVALLTRYLPQQITGAALVAEVDRIIAAEGLTGPKAMGAVMKTLSATHAGAYDGAEASAVVRARLATPA